MKDYMLIPFVCGAGGTTPGAETGAPRLKSCRLIESLAQENIPIRWYIDPKNIYDSPWGQRAHETLAPRGSKQRNDIVYWHCAQIKNHVKDAIDKGHTPITIGGDHSMALGSVSGLAAATDSHGQIGLLWIDAHSDCNTPETSFSQSLHGMPVAALCGFGAGDFTAIAGDKAVLDPRHICYIGLRDVDPGEWDFIRTHNITAFTIEDVQREGVQEIFAKARKIITNGTKHCAISVDLDAFDPNDAPSVGTAVPNGLPKEETLAGLQQLIRDIHPSLMEIAEYNATIDGQELTQALIADLLKIMAVPA